MPLTDHDDFEMNCSWIEDEDPMETNEQSLEKITVMPLVDYDFEMNCSWIADDDAIESRQQTTTAEKLDKPLSSRQRGFFSGKHCVNCYKWFHAIRVFGKRFACHLCGEWLCRDCTFTKSISIAENQVAKVHVCSHCVMEYIPIGIHAKDMRLSLQVPSLVFPKRKKRFEDDDGVKKRHDEHTMCPTIEDGDEEEEDEELDAFIPIDLHQVIDRR